MASLIAAGGLSGSAFARVGGEFVLQMAVGAAVGVLGGWALLVFVRRVSLPSEGLYPLRTLASVLLIYGVAAIAHGSGFLAVFAAGIVVGDARVPYRREVRRFHAALAGLAEIVAFVVLGLTVDLGELTKAEVLVPGLVVGAVLAFVIRPLFVSLCLVPAHLARNERNFVLFAGLKGAVPILLGGLVRHAHLPDSERLYGIVVVVVVFSVVVQGGLTPTVARWWRFADAHRRPEALVGRRAPGRGAAFRPDRHGRARSSRRRAAGGRRRSARLDQSRDPQWPTAAHHRRDRAASRRRCRPW